MRFYQHMKLLVFQSVLFLHMALQPITALKLHNDDELLQAGNAGSPVQLHPHSSGSQAKYAFVAMLCRTKSGWDRPDGLGSEMGTLAHGHAMKQMHNHLNIDNVLLHATGGMCQSDFLCPAAMEKAYDKIITLDGKTKAEQEFLSWRGGWLWLKLLAMNLTEYDTVMWMGFDTLPLAPLDVGFSCVPTPCISNRGNADLMVFKPNATEFDLIVDDLRANRSSWEYNGKGGYDQAYLKHRYRGMGRLPTVPWHHYGAKKKPWFQAYCQTLVGTNQPFWTNVNSVCGSTAVSDGYAYMWWQVAKEALQSAPDELNQCPDPFKEYSVEEELKQFPAGFACTPITEEFPQLVRWCNESWEAARPRPREVSIESVQA